ncbi:uncharacterized protein LOC144085945 isoform X2 [Stigmatopora argus]
MDRKVLVIFLCVQAFLLITAVNSDKGEGQPQQEITQGRYWRPGAHSGLAGEEGHRSGIYRIVNMPIPLTGKPLPESDEMQPQNTTPNSRRT